VLHVTAAGSQVTAPPGATTFVAQLYDFETNPLGVLSIDFK